MCALLVGLPDVRVVGVGEWPQWVLIVIAIDWSGSRAVNAKRIATVCAR